MQKKQILFFIDDYYIAEFYSSQIKKKEKDALIKIYSDFEQCCKIFVLEYSKSQFILFDYYLFDYTKLSRQIQESAKGIEFSFITNQGIDGVEIDVIPVSVPKANYARTADGEDAIIQRCFRGTDLCSNPQYICEELLKRAYFLHGFKNIHVSEPYLNLNEFFENLIHSILSHLKIACGNVVVWETSSDKELYRKVINEETSLLNYKFYPKHKIPLKSEVKDIEKINNETLRNELKSKKIKYHILIVIKSQYVQGYLDLFSKLDRISSTEREVIELIEKHIPMVLDNVHFFQKMLIKAEAGIEIFDNTEDGLLIVDKNRRVVDLNEATERFTGWSRNEALGKPCKLLYHSCSFNGTPLCDPASCPMLTPLHEKKSTVRHRVYTRDKSGKRKVAKAGYHFHKSVVGDTIYGIAIVRDLTKRVMIEKQLHHFEQLSCLGKFAAELAHEIRNPVTGITSNAQYLCENTKLTRSQRDIIQEIIQGASRIETTIKKFLHLSHPPKPHLTQVNVNSLIRETISLVANQLDKARIKLHISLSRSPLSLNLDYDLIQQVFINIIMNSIEAMKSGGTLTIKSRKIRHREGSNRKKGESIQIIIADTGSGISSENLEKVFDPFFTTKPTGSGLGLYTAYRMVKNHGGTIEVRSKGEKGTEVIITFRR